MSQPTIVQGPAIVVFDSVSYYVKEAIKVAVKTESFIVKSDMHGSIDERKKSVMVEISFTPVGMIANLDKHFPYAVTDIGSSIFGVSDKPVAIKTKSGQVITYSKGAIMQMPQLRLRPVDDTVFGEMKIVCIQKSATAITAADFLKAITSASFADANFDETKVKTMRYTAAFGSSPYDAMLALDGFTVDIAMKTANIPADDIGIADIILEDLTATASFKPASLTEAQIDTLMKHSNTGAIDIGESFTKSDTDLVITSAGLVVTIKKAGPKDMSYQYGTGKHRHEALGFTSRRTWTAGVADALWTLTIPS